MFLGSPAQAVINANANNGLNSFPLLSAVVKEIETGSILYQGPLKLNQTDSTGRETYLSGKFFPTCRPFVVQVSHECT
jgi:hypothetical protein